MRPDATSLSRRLSMWAAGFALADAPPRVQATARSLVLSQLAAARASRQHDVGQRLVAAFGSPLQDDPRRAAFVMAALTIALDFDDTVYAGHVSHSAINVPLLLGARSGAGGEQVLEAAIAAIECASRVTAAATLGRFRGQSAAYAHLAGALVGRLRLEGAPVGRWVDAFGIAFGAPPWPLMRAFLATDAKVLAAAGPVGSALDACDAAGAGLTGAEDVLEHPDGFLAAYADVPLPDAVVAGLGVRWHTETASFKVRPGSAYIGSAVDCALDLHGRLGDAAADAVEDVLVEASIFTCQLTQRSAAYADGPGSSPVALGFSVPYNVATALLTGRHAPADLGAEPAADPARWRLAAKVRVVEDDQLSLRAVVSTAPLGAALRQAGPRARTWLEAAVGSRAELVMDHLGPVEETFERADKALGARVTVRLRDGRTLVAERSAAEGAAGHGPAAHHEQLMRDKYLATGGTADVVDAVARLELQSPAAVRDLLSTALGG